MTTSISNQQPPPDADNISGRPFVQFSLTSNDPLAPVIQETIQVSFGGRDFIVNGQPQDGLDVMIESNASLGFDVTMRQELPESTWVEVGVQATGISSTWKFRTGDDRGPRAVSVLPAQFEDGASATPVISFTIIDDNVEREPAEFVVEQTAADGERTGNVLHSDTIDFRNREGRVIQVSGVENIVNSVLGPHDAVTDLSGAESGATLNLYADRGLDIWVDGAQLVHSGEDVSSGDWTVSVVKTGNEIDVTLTRAGPALSGRIDVQVMVSDDDPQFHNTSRLNWFFDVGDTKAPVITNVAPANGSKGLVDSPPENLAFDITDNGTGVDSATLDVEVDGVAAITAGVGVGDFSGSTVAPIGGGYTVTLVKGTDWVDGGQVFVDVVADDTTGNSMRAVLNFHFGNPADTEGLSIGDGNLPEDDIKRVVAFDLSNTSFGRPVELRHTGYAYDGHLYDQGAISDQSPAEGDASVDNLASWFTETAGTDRGSQAAFPLSGYVVATAGYWTILDQNSDMWMRCPVVGVASPAWSMAGSAAASITDADFGEDATLFVSGEGVIAVDFSADAAVRYSTDGREPSDTDISSRALDQNTGALDASYALTSNAVAKVAGVAWQRGQPRSVVTVACGPTTADIIAELSPEFLTSTGSADPEKVVPLSFTSPSWSRARLSADDADGVLAMMLMRDEAGQAKLSTYNWLSLLTSPTPAAIHTFDNSNDLPVEAGADFDALRQPGVWLLAVATADTLTIIEVAASGASSTQTVQRSLADLGMVFGVNPRLLSVAIEESFEFGLGHLYVSGTEDGAAGRITRYREQSATASAAGQVTQVGTDVLSSIDSMGVSELGGGSLLRASMNVAAEGFGLLRASMDVV
jgi:hypothetical protein